MIQAIKCFFGFHPGRGRGDRPDTADSTILMRECPSCHRLYGEWV